MIKHYPQIHSMQKSVHLLFLVCYILCSSSLYGQVVKGTVLSDGEPMEYASISLFSHPDSSLMNGGITNEQGTFEITEVKSGEFYISIQFVGYDTYYSAVFPVEKTVDLGAITLGVNSLALQEVEVTGRAITSLHKIDKQVFDAQQFQAATGGTAIDVLKNLPSVSVDALGNISVRGETRFILMLNGKPIQGGAETLLASIPANAIDDIEVITAPSAKYDPDGKAGIINIKTKAKLNEGLLLNANVLVGLPSIEDYDNAENAPRYGADVSINYKQGKWDLSGGLDYRRYDISGQRDGYVNTYVNGVLTEFPSFGERSFDEENYSARFSAVYTPNEKQSIGASFYAGKRTKERTADILYNNQTRTQIAEENFLGPEAYWDLFQQTGMVLQGGPILNQFTFFNENLRVRRGDFFIGAIDYQIEFEENAFLKLTALYEHTLLGGPTDNVSLSWPDLRDTFQLQFNDNDNPLDGVRLQADFSKKYNNMTWESGYQFRYLKHPGDFVYLDRNFDTDEWVENPLFTNGIELRRSIHSLYSQISGSWEQLQYTIGLRLEYFDRQVEVDVPAETFMLDQLNPFPSMNLQYNVSGSFALKAGYSRRIERTTTFKMTPFPEREHSETLEQGDAELLPEYIDLVELGLVKNWEDNSVFVTAYYRHIENVINRVNTIFPEGDTILNRIYTNAGNAQAFGVEGGITFYPAKWARIYVGANVYNYRIEGNLFEEEINTSNTIYSINSNATLDFSDSWNLQLGFNYLSERVTAQGRDSRFYNPNLTLRKELFDKQLALSVQWINIDMGILNSNEQRITTVQDDFYTTTNYIYEVDIIQLTASYRLNQSNKQIKLLKSEFGAKEF